MDKYIPNPITLGIGLSLLVAGIALTGWSAGLLVVTGGALAYLAQATPPLERWSAGLMQLRRGALRRFTHEIRYHYKHYKPQQGMSWEDLARLAGWPLGVPLPENASLSLWPVARHGDGLTDRQRLAWELCQFLCHDATLDAGQSIDELDQAQGELRDFFDGLGCSMDRWMARRFIVRVLEDYSYVFIMVAYFDIARAVALPEASSRGPGTNDGFWRLGNWWFVERIARSDQPRRLSKVLRALRLKR